MFTAFSGDKLWNVISYCSYFLVFVFMNENYILDLNVFGELNFLLSIFITMFIFCLENYLLTFEQNRQFWQ